jgi:hypothetical protein
MLGNPSGWEFFHFLWRDADASALFIAWNKLERASAMTGGLLRGNADLVG